ncbi:MAG: glycosyltransferase family 4 protein [Bacteroidaceae bacterium]
MNIIYCTHSTYNPGGMERVLLNKVTWMVKHLNWKVTVVTTDQKGRAPFYPFPSEVRMVDLGINYSDDNSLGTLRKVMGYLRRRRQHRKRLTDLLMRERADIVVSLFPSESSFLPDIKDGSRKVLELHFCKFFRLQYGRSGLMGMIDRWRTRQDEHLVRRFDRFVVLTREDHGYWGGLPNIEVIPNAALFPTINIHSDVSVHRVIAVGRLDYQKGFDRLIEAWHLVQTRGVYGDWHLDIFGQGEWREMLQEMITEKGLEKTTCINKPTNAIWDEYLSSSILVMSSNYEGFGMVLVEAMACGVPVVSFECKCGPRDIIRDGVNGLLVPEGDIQGLADALMRLMDDEQLRKQMAANAVRVTETYSEEQVMGQWVKLFQSLA